MIGLDQGVGLDQEIEVDSWDIMIGTGIGKDHIAIEETTPLLDVVDLHLDVVDLHLGGAVLLDVVDPHLDEVDPHLDVLDPHLDVVDPLPHVVIVLLLDVVDLLLQDVIVLLHVVKVLHHVVIDHLLGAQVHHQKDVTVPLHVIGVEVVVIALVPLV